MMAAQSRKGWHRFVSCPSSSWQVIAPVLLFALLLVSSASAQAPLTIEWQEGRLSVIAEHVPLPQILREVAHRTGVEVEGLEGLEESVTVRFAALPLREALEKLLAHRNYAILEEPTPQGDERPARVVVAGRRAPPPPAAVPSGEETRPEGVAVAEATIPGPDATEPEREALLEQNSEERLAALRTYAQEGNEEALRKALLEPDQMVQATGFQLLAERDPQRAVAALAEAAKSDQPAARFQALTLLDQSGQAEEGTVLFALREGLADEDGTVKAYAIQALAGRGGAEGLAALDQAYRDADPSIKLTILESVAQREQGLRLLREALEDEDETVRSFAAFWLEQARSEGR